MRMTGSFIYSGKIKTPYKNEGYDISVPKMHRITYLKNKGDIPRKRYHPMIYKF